MIMDLSTIEEKQRFSDRLCGEFQRLALPVNSPTEIARILNRKLPQLSVTPQSVRKWLFAEAYPTQDKIMMLSDWLGVSAQWLRFGEGEKFTVNKLAQLTASHQVPANLLLLSAEYECLIPLVDKLAKLSAKDLRVVEGLVEILLNEQKQLNS